ncbi:shikimate dehydrogenase family protein [Sandaracinobacteroides saxicola]|uniref:Shikimate dehydrogenase (NADP(+)) n=1 Tax=Sandaracinobacteroides saxicola TaxID=2759707 RepID=A0A7G5IH95_9SPHN|nr:shikimate dehydrogenase [Sandaracinobacteroides saxicola]QMW22737.1 shikimate dehydrogenase [Sandaracinobacteroides saxicola]
MSLPVAGVVGWPVAHSKSPLIHRFWLRCLSLDGEYVRLPVKPEALPAALAGLPVLGFRGVNVTVPHKEAALRACGHVDASAAAVGAANIVCVREDGTLSAHNSDVQGVLAAGLPKDGLVVIGAGGAARAALTAASLVGAKSVTLVVRDAAKGRALLAAFRLVGDVIGFEEGLPAATAMLVNAGPLGMVGQPAMPLPLLVAVEGLRADASVFDMVYAPLETDLLGAARRRGLRVVDGLTMLIAQAAAAFRLFYGVEAPRERDAELRGLLGG